MPGFGERRQASKQLIRMKAGPLGCGRQPFPGGFVVVQIEIHPALCEIQRGAVNSSTQPACAFPERIQLLQIQRRIAGVRGNPALPEPVIAEREIRLLPQPVARFRQHLKLHMSQRILEPWPLPGL
ncbi:hypothetical protein D3C75_783630 [compost metagenome]